MTLKLKHILPGIGAGRGEIENDAFVDLDSGLIKKPCSGSSAGLREIAGQS